MPAPDHYLVLGITQDASQETIKTAFRRLALKYHPDKNPGNTEAIEMFTAIHSAYETLSHPEKRRTYDLSRPGKQEVGFSPAIERSVIDKSKIQIAVDRRVLRLDEILQVTIRLFQSNVKIHLSGLSHFELAEGPIINSLFPPGKNNPEMEITYLLKPKEQGYVEIGPASFIANGTRYLSELFHIKINQPPDLITYRPASKMEVFQGVTSAGVIVFYLCLIGFNIYQYKIYPFIREPKPAIAAGPVMLRYAQLATGVSPFEKYFGQGRYDAESLHRIVFHNGKLRDAVVLLMDVQTNQPVRNNYIRAGDDLVMGNIPEGTYYLKAIFGNDWNGKLCLAEKENICGGFNKNMHYENFQQDGNVLTMQRSRSGDTLDYKIYEITLYPVQDGNVRSAPTEAGRFWGE